MESVARLRAQQARLAEIQEANKRALNFAGLFCLSTGALMVVVVYSTWPV